MIRLIREGSQKYPGVLKLIMIVIAVTFIIGMGWFGFENSQVPNAVALVGPYPVTIKEFRRAYNQAYRFYRDELKQKDIDEASLKQRVVGQLVDSKVWIVTADELDLAISPTELKHAIMNLKEFQKDGSFDAERYHRLLTQNKLSPKHFELQMSTDLLSRKAQMVVQDMTTLTPTEIEEVDALASRQIAGIDDPAEIAQTRERVRLQFLFQKKERALQAFHAAMRGQAEIEIREEYL